MCPFQLSPLTLSDHPVPLTLRSSRSFQETFHGALCQLISTAPIMPSKISQKSSRRRLNTLSLHDALPIYCVNSEASEKRGDQTVSAAKAEMDTSGTKAKTGILNFKSTLRNSWQSDPWGFLSTTAGTLKRKQSWGDRTVSAEGLRWRRKRDTRTSKLQKTLSNSHLTYRP